MTTLITRSRTIALAVTAAALLCGSQARAQQFVNPNFRVGPYLSLQQAAFNISTVGRAYANVPPYALGYNPYPSPILGGGYGAPAYNPYMAGSLSNSIYGGDYSGYTNPYMSSYDPYGGELRGVADIINAQGKFMNLREQSFITREQSKQARLETRRKIFEEWQYERANTPSLEDLREQDQRMQRRRALNDPPFTEILSATSLNTLLDHSKTVQGGGARGTSVALDEDTLKRINVTAGNGGNIGLLKNDGYLQWPLPLKAQEFSADRDALDKAMPKLVSQASTNGRVGASELTAAQKNLDTLNEKLADRVGEIGTSQYIESKRYLNFLGEALRALNNEDVANYFNQKFAAKGKTIAELVKYMSDKGLRFAPATPGDESAYRALHQALATYDGSLSQNVAEKEKEK